MGDTSDAAKIRSVNDFDTRDGLRYALKHNEEFSSFNDIGRDFPRALIGSSLGLPREDDSMSDCSTVFEADTDLDWMLSNYNASTSEMQTLDEELNRLQVLKSYLILDSEREANFERLTGLAARMFNVPIALVSLVDLGRQWFMSNRGLGDVRETPRKLAFCAHAIISKEDLLIVPDATKDPRFSSNPLVTGPPHIRFYGGAPLLCPEGYKLGTLCLIDTKTRPDGLSFEDKQSLRELASLVVDAMVERRREKLRVLQDKSQIIATTAHDLLTPLSGVQMSLSLLLEDDELKQRLSTNQTELIETAAACGDIMQRICNNAIEIFRGDVDKHNKRGLDNKVVPDQVGPKPIIVSELVKNLNMVMDPFPKKVPLFISVDPLVPPSFISDDLKVFRSAINFLTNALKKTEKGNVHLKLYVAGKKKKPKLVFECEDTGPGIEVDKYQYLFRPFREISDGDNCIRVGEGGILEAGVCHSNMAHSGLGLYSVANQISSIGGEYGFRPREFICPPEADPNTANGSIFWFSIPLIVPKENTGPDQRSTRSYEHDRRGNDMSAKSLGSSQNSSLSLLKSAKVLSTRTLNPSDAAEVFLTVSQVIAAEHERQASTTKLDPGGQRIKRALVIDDSIVIRKSIGRALSKLGFDVTMAVNGLEGLKQLQQQVYDVVLCDFLMPVMDGLDCVQQYRDWEEAHRPWVRQYIIGISAHASSTDVEKGKKAGMNDFKSKPVTMKHLKELQNSDELLEVSKTLDEVLTIDTSMEGDGLDGDSSGRRLQLEGTQRSAQDGPVCLVVESSGTTIMKEAVENLGWHSVHVNDGEDALRLLKMRNWDAVFIEHEIPRLTGQGCVERFRMWESENRVARQNNVYLLTTDFTPSPEQSIFAVYPDGFDGALGKPILMKDLKALLVRAEANISEMASSNNILSR